MIQPTPEYLREALDYDPETGLLRWKVRPASHFGSPQDCNRWNAQFAGKPAFAGSDKDGYANGTISDRSYRAHRVIFAIIHGRWPTLQIDHRDGCRSNNRPNNLREATTTQQRQNEGSRKNRTGFKGVAPSNPSYPNTRYHARIQVAGQWRYLGNFDTPEEAHAAYQAAATEHFGEFARSA